MILDLILVGAKIFSDERKRYYENKVKKLKRKIIAEEDKDFYDKDMNAKAKAERELAIESNSLALEFLNEANK